MRLSTRITGITPGGSDGWEVFARAREMIAAGTRVTELTIGEHDVRTAERVLAAMHQSALGGHTGYAAVPGTNALRDAVAERVTSRTGVLTKRDNVLITPGGQAALFAAHIAACDPGDTALFIDPFYATYPGTLRGAGAVARAVPTEAANGFSPEKSILSKAAHGARSLLINSPNNPTGVVYDRDTLEGIAEVCIAHDLWLISDEVYDTQVWEGTHLSPRALPGMIDRTLVVGSMSKSHAMTGSRCGWLIGPKHAIRHLSNLATHTTYGVPGFIQDASVFALAQGAAFEDEIAAPFLRRRAIAQKVIGAQQVVRMIPSQGAMYVMLDVRDTRQSASDFAFDLLEKHHIAVMPGESFGAAAAGHVRVALTVEDDTLKVSMETLCAHAAALAARAPSFKIATRTAS